MHFPFKFFPKGLNFRDASCGPSQMLIFSTTCCLSFPQQSSGLLSGFWGLVPSGCPGAAAAAPPDSFPGLALPLTSLCCH